MPTTLTVNWNGCRFICRRCTVRGGAVSCLHIMKYLVDCEDKGVVADYFKRAKNGSRIEPIMLPLTDSVEIPFKINVVPDFGDPESLMIKLSEVGIDGPLPPIFIGENDTFIKVVRTARDVYSSLEVFEACMNALRKRTRLPCAFPEHSQSSDIALIKKIRAESLSLHGSPLGREIYEKWETQQLESIFFEVALENAYSIMADDRCYACTLSAANASSFPEDLVPAF